MKKQYTVDLGSFGLEARNQDEAYKKAVEMINSGWVEIDQVFEDS